MLGRPGTTGSERVEALAGGVLRTPTDGPRSTPRRLRERRRNPAIHPPLQRFSDHSQAARQPAGADLIDLTERARSVWGDTSLSPVSHSPATHTPRREQVLEASGDALTFRPGRTRRNRAAEIWKGAGETRHTPCSTGRVRDGAFPTTQFSAQPGGPGKAKERAQ